jgi:hypothetical protein
MCTVLRCSTTITSSRTRSRSSKLSTDLIESLLPRLIRCYRSSGVGFPVPPKQAIGPMNRVNFLFQSGKPRSLNYIGLHARYSWSKTHSTTVTAVTIPENRLWIFPHRNARCRCSPFDREESMRVGSDRITTTIEREWLAEIVAGDEEDRISTDQTLLDETVRKGLFALELRPLNGMNPPVP